MKTPSLLIVDDEPNNFDVIETLLADYEYDLHYLSNGQDTINSIDILNPDLILLDVMMPEMNGIEVCGKIKLRPNWQSIPILMVTALTSKQDLALCLDAGADDFISKPINSFELRARVKSLLRIKKQYDRMNEFSILQRDTINMLNRNLQELNKSISSSFPHELNTPLNGIRGVIDILKQDLHQLDKLEIQTMLSWAEESAIRLENLTKKFLLYLELELSASQGKVYKPESCKLSAFAIQKALTFFAETFKRGDDLNFNLQQAIVLLSLDNLSFILHELVSNAIRFSDKGTIIVIETAIENDFLRLTVKDQGKGMKPEQISQVGAFMQFERQQYAQEGLGLGLKIVMNMVDKVGGKFSIDSIYGKGTKVNVYLPIQN